MALQSPDFINAPLVNRDYAFLGNALENYAKGYQTRVANRYLEPEAQAQLINDQEKAKQMQILSQFLTPSEKARIALMQAQAQQAQGGAAKGLAFARILNQYASGDDLAGSPFPAPVPSIGVQGSSSPVPSALASSVQGNVSYSAPPVQPGSLANAFAQQPNILQQQQPANASPRDLQRAIIGAGVLKSVLPGIMEPKVIDVDGNRMLLTPKGLLPVAQGETPLQLQLNKQDAKTISGFDTSAISADRSLSTLDNIKNTLVDPEWQNMRKANVFPGLEFKSILATGTPYQKRLAGNFIASSNQIIKDSARDFPGQFRKGEQALMEKMKITEKDNYDTAVGKYQALALFANLMKQRSQMASALARTGRYSPIQAVEVADKQINADAIRSQINQSLGIKNTVKIAAPNGKVYDVPEDQADEAITKGGGKRV